MLTEITHHFQLIEKSDKCFQSRTNCSILTKIFVLFWTCKLFLTFKKWEISKWKGNLNTKWDKYQNMPSFKWKKKLHFHHRKSLTGKKQTNSKTNKQKNNKQSNVLAFWQMWLFSGKKIFFCTFFSKRKENTPLTWRKNFRAF